MWEQIDGELAHYSQDIKEGFVLTKGRKSFCFEDSPYEGSVYFPTFQLLKVHKEHPFEFKYGGRIILQPKIDNSFIGEVLRKAESNPNLYDAVSFVLSPYDVSLKENDIWKNIGVFHECFLLPNSQRNSISLLYLDAKMEIDGSDVNTLSIVPDSLIDRHFVEWIYSIGDINSYVGERKFGEGWINLGRVDFNKQRCLGNVVLDVCNMLEKRFSTRLLTERS